MEPTGQRRDDVTTGSGSPIRRGAAMEPAAHNGTITLCLYRNVQIVPAAMEPATGRQNDIVYELVNSLATVGSQWNLRPRWRASLMQCLTCCYGGRPQWGPPSSGTIRRLVPSLEVLLLAAMEPVGL